jgi:hypothetical protein
MQAQQSNVYIIDNDISSFGFEQSEQRLNKG